MSDFDAKMTQEGSHAVQAPQAAQAPQDSQPAQAAQAPQPAQTAQAPQPAQTPQAAPQISKKRRILGILEPVGLVAMPVIVLTLALLKAPGFAVLSAFVVILCMLPFFLDFEAQNFKARDLMPIVVMAALGVAGRLVFAPVPAVKPVIAIAIVTGLSFGGRTGFITGALIALVSNIFFGQGAWTPWQMYAWGLAGYLSGVFASKGWLRADGKFIYVYGFLMAYLSGGILDVWTYLGFVSTWSLETAAITFGGGLVYNFGLAVGTVLFLIPIAGSWTRKFDRVKRKYGIGFGAPLVKGDAQG